jgi:hypothetical protein
MAQLQQALQLARSETQQAQAAAAHAQHQAAAAAQAAASSSTSFVPAPAPAMRSSEMSQRVSSRGGFATSGSGDLASYDAEGGGGVLAGEAFGKFEPLLVKVKQLGQKQAALRNPHVLRVAGQLDRASGYLHKRPLWRLGLLVYVLLVHVMWLLF